MKKLAILVRKTYHQLFPYYFRCHVRRLIFQNLLRKFKLLTCNNYIELNASNAKEIIQQKRPEIAVYIFSVEKDEVEPAIHPEDQNIPELERFTPKTENIVLDIPGSSNFSFRNNHLLDSELNVINEYGTSLEKLPIYTQLLELDLIKLSGTVVYLSNTSPSNYYHWMCRTLPLIRIYKEFCDLQSSFFYVGKFSIRDFHRESLARAGISMHQIIQDACTADRLVTAITTRDRRFGDPINQEAYKFSRNLFLSDQMMSGGDFAFNRIYVSRGKQTFRRRVINESDVISLLQKYDFQVMAMDGLSIREQAKVFSSAKTIIAPHGAALTNLLFIRPGSVIVELIPHGYVNNCYHVLSSHAGGKYFYLLGEKVDQIGDDKHSLDMYIDIDKLDRICQQILC